MNITVFKVNMKYLYIMYLIYSNKLNIIIAVRYLLSQIFVKYVYLNKDWFNLHKLMFNLKYLNIYLFIQIVILMLRWSIL